MAKQSNSPKRDGEGAKEHRREEKTRRWGKNGIFGLEGSVKSTALSMVRALFVVSTRGNKIAAYS